MPAAVAPYKTVKAVKISLCLDRERKNDSLKVSGFADQTLT